MQNIREMKIGARQDSNEGVIFDGDIPNEEGPGDPGGARADANGFPSSVDDYVLNRREKAKRARRARKEKRDDYLKEIKNSR